MSIETPGDGKSCDRCPRRGVPYEYRGQQFSGLIANRGELLCRPCMDAESETVGVNILVVDGRPGIPDWIYNTVRDRDLVFPRNPGGIDGRDLGRRARRSRT